ncbi:MAG: hypothetical protein DMG13_21840 [Acidobacteria bacterium]|nr:MAG: hypothetical protein DMG13_21840 [Acidobacteriota bacterium]
MGIGTSANGKRLVLLLWILVGFFYFYLSFDYIRASMNDESLADYLQYLVQIAGTEQRPAKEIRTLILLKAEQLELPVRSEQIRVLGIGDTLKVSLNYQVDIQIPVLQTAVYSKQFEHTVRYRRIY